MTTTKPDKEAGSGKRDTRFKPGQSGNPAGRPRGYDLRAIAEKKAAAEGIPLEDALWLVIKAMLREAGKGDVQAAKLIFDKLCTAEAIDLNVNHSGTIAAASGEAPTGKARTEWLRRFSAMAQEELRAAEAIERN